MQVLTRIECPSCDKSGISSIKNSCDLCGAIFSEAQMARLDEEISWLSPSKPSLPCLHEFRNLKIEEIPCSACVGTGHQELWLDLEKMINQVISGWSVSDGTPLKRISR